MKIFPRNKYITKVQLPHSKIDERDTMFARMARKRGTRSYEDYYKRHPELKQKDDYLRSLHPLLKRGGKFYDKVVTSEAQKLFNSIESIQIDEFDLTYYYDQIKSLIPSSNSLKRIILEMGAVAVGVTDLNNKYIYSHKGRFDSEYGISINASNPNIIVFLVEMDHSNMQLAPKAETIFESANQYYNAALISKMLERLITNLGYKAKAHYDTHYDVILPPLAIKAGLGELGRNNILIADKYGSRVRIGAVSTDLPIEYDKPISIGANKFCKICNKCTDNCPSKALASGEKIEINGVKKWPTNIEKCYTIWRKFGTDCGICMAACPFSHKNNLLHNFVRYFVKRFPVLNRLFVYMDDLIYGKKWKTIL